MTPRGHQANSVRDRLELAPVDVALTGGAGAVRGEAPARVIRPTRLLVESRRHASEQAALFQIGQAAISSLDLASVLMEIARATLGLVEADCCAIDIWHRETDQLELAAEAARSGWPLVERVGMLLPLVARAAERLALEEATPLLIGSGDARAGADELTFMTAGRVEQLLIVPLVVGETCLGAMRVVSRTPRAFGDASFRLGQEIAAQTALAIQNARHL